ncbi:MAG: hypothetical protein U0Z17_02320 [Bacteroidales bacterium]
MHHAFLSPTLFMDVDGMYRGSIITTTKPQVSKIIQPFALGYIQGIASLVHTGAAETYFGYDKLYAGPPAAKRAPHTAGVEPLCKR